MAIRKLPICINYSDEQEEFLDYLRPMRNFYWDTRTKIPHKKWGTLATLNRLKSFIREKLITSHGLFCSYCGLKLKETSGDEIDHIAPKSNYPEFTFEPLNLVLSCTLCNGPTKKHTYNSIEKLAAQYENCTFKIVHPYFDDPSLHYSYKNTENGIPAIIELKTSKAIESNELFKLDSPEMTEARVKDGLLQMYPITQADEQLIKNVMSFNRALKLK